MIISIMALLSQQHVYLIISIMALLSQQHVYLMEKMDTVIIHLMTTSYTILMRTSLMMMRCCLSCWMTTKAWLVAGEITNMHTYTYI